MPQYTDKARRQYFSQVGVYCTHGDLRYQSAFGLPELDLLELSRQQKSWILIQVIQCRVLFSIRPGVANLRAKTCFNFTMVFSVFHLKASYQSSYWLSVLFVLPICPNVLILVTKCFVFIYGRIRIPTIAFVKKIRPFRIGIQGPFRIGKIIPLRIGKNRTPPNWDPPQWQNTGPFQIGTPPDRQKGKPRPFRIRSQSLLRKITN